MEEKILTIDYYSDVLCIWAWIAQRRIDELNKHFGEKIVLKHYYVDIFGDTQGKMLTQWADRGGIKGFAEHVQASASNFEDAPTHPDIWRKVIPSTSANAHLFLKAIEKIHGDQKAIEMALTLRQAFYIEAQDISNIQALRNLAKQEDLDDEQIQNTLNNGQAMAMLMSDYKRANIQNVKGSPSYVMDSGRQTLYGNVGYRVLHANIEELLKNPANEASWC